MNEITRLNIETYQTPYAVATYSAERGLFPVEAHVIDRYFPPPPARLLDIGCGAGRTTRELVSRGYQVTAIDLADKLLEVCRKAVPEARCCRMDASKLGFASESFDVALFSFNGLDIIYPRSARYATLREIRRVLKPGGVFYYSGHNGLGSLVRGRGKGWRRRVGTLARFTVRQLQVLSKLREGYCAYADQCGAQLLYSAPPKWHLGDLAAAGFAPVAVYGTSRVRDEHRVSLCLGMGAKLTASALFRLSFFAHHVNYIGIALPLGS